MVGSEVVVGIVGAVALVLALGGVFTYEALRPLDTTLTFGDKVRNATAQGTVVIAPRGQAQAPAPCNPMIAQTCAPAKTEVTLVYKTLPNAEPLPYVVFLQKGSAYVNLGALHRVGVVNKSYDFHFGPDANDQSTATSLIVSLEKDATATMPSLVVDTYVLSGPTTAISQTRAVDWIKSSEPHSLTFTSSGVGHTVKATMRNMPFHPGFVYRGWIMHQDPANLTHEEWTYVGVFTPGNGTAASGTQTGTIEGKLAHEQMYYAEFVATLEKAAAEPGKAPAGPEVAEDEYNDK